VIFYTFLSLIFGGAQPLPLNTGEWVSKLPSYAC